VRLICAYFFLRLTLLRNTDPSTTGMIRPSSPTTAATRNPTKSSNGSGYVSVAGLLYKVSSASIHHWYLPCTRSRVPVNGSKDLQDSGGLRRFAIERSGDPMGLPRSHIHGSMSTWRVSCCICTEECCLE